jgi:hypothetical protein
MLRAVSDRVAGPVEVAVRGLLVKALTMNPLLPGADNKV